MNLRRIAAAVAAATVTLTMTPAANAAGLDHRSNPGTQAHASAKPALPDTTETPDFTPRTATTRSLYRRAGLALPQRLAADSATQAGTSATASPVLIPGLRDHVNQSCTGTGTDGARVQVMYVREADMADRFADVAPVLRNEMRYADDVVAMSAMDTGGGRRIRWVTDASCNLSVLNVVLPDGAISGSYGLTENALRDAGYLKANRKYIAFADVAAGNMSGDGGSVCGLGSKYTDSKPTDNLNDGRYPQMARVDRDCWVTPNSRDASVALHELMHTLGAVQSDAPHGTAAGHCTDESDLMCYNDGGGTTQVCPVADEVLLDCNHDDYFNTNPAAGSYLASHWNVANSPFLDTVAPLPAPPTVTITPSTPNAQTEETVTFTANVQPGTTVNWSTDAPQCENTGSSTTGTTFSVQCFSAAKVTATATASNSGYTLGYASAAVTYSASTAPTLGVTSPKTAAVGTPFSMTAKVTNSTSAWTYSWNLRTSGCTSSNGTTSPTVNVTCDNTTEDQIATFTVAATRTADGATYTTTVGVQMSASGTPVVTVDGPTTLTAGTTGTFNATVTGATSPTYSWSSLNGWSNGPFTQSSFNVTPPAGVTSGSDTIFLTVTSSTGKTTSLSFAYTVNAALSMTMTGPNSLTPNSLGTYKVNPSKSATVTWEQNQDNGGCVLFEDGGPNTVDLICSESFLGTVIITATATAGNEKVTRTKTVTVSNTPPVQPRDTTMFFSATGTYPTYMSARLSDKKSGNPLANKTVQIEQRDPDGTYRAIKEMQTDSNGNLKFDMAITKVAYYRVEFTGDDKYNASVSPEQRVDVFTRLTGSKTSTGLVAHLTTGWKVGIANVSLVLQKKATGARSWSKVGSYKTTAQGVVTVKMNPTKATYYRWVFAGSSNYRSSQSGQTRLT